MSKYSIAVINRDDIRKIVKQIVNYLLTIPVSSLHQVAKVLELQLQHQSFQ